LPPSLAAVWLGLAISGLHCKRSPDPAAIDERAACAAACAALISAGCERDGLRRQDHDRCVQHCAAHGAGLASAGCGSERAGYLTCVAKMEPDCERLTCSAALCIERAVGLGVCRDSYERWRQCAAPCLDPGSSHFGERVVSSGATRQRVTTEIVRSGCAECAPAKRGAPAGSACQAASVCSQICCRCPGNPAKFLARACVDGVCEEGEAACELSRRALGLDPCTTAK